MIIQIWGFICFEMSGNWTVILTWIWLDGLGEVRWRICIAEQLSYFEAHMVAGLMLSAKFLEVENRE